MFRIILFAKKMIEEIDVQTIIVSGETSWIWWLLPLISTLERPRQEDNLKSEARLGYILAQITEWDTVSRHCFKKKLDKMKENKLWHSDKHLWPQQE